MRQGRMPHPFRPLDWNKVDDILALFERAWGPGHNTPGEHLAAVWGLKIAKAHYPREYNLAMKWFDNPNVRR